jgi:two-component system, response regulator YesN
MIKKIKVLCIDDNIQTLELYRYLLDNTDTFIHGPIYTADNEETALDILNQDKIDLIISDITRPGKGGLKFWSSLQEKKIKSKIIFVSGSRNDTNIKDIVLKSGASGFISKPFDCENLLESIEKLYYSK